MERNTLNQCLTKIEQKLGWGSAEGWTSTQFQELADLIALKSGITVNAKTLWRLFKKERSNPDYQPQRATKDALAVFVGYTSWVELIAQTEPTPVEAPAAPPPDYVDTSQAPPPTSAPPRRRYGWVYAVLAPLVVGLAALWFWQSERPYQYRPILKASHLGGPVPQTIWFDIKRAEIADDSVLLYFGTKPTPIRLANRDQRTSKVYQYPMYGACRLTRLNGQLLDSIRLHLTSPNWTKGVLSGNRFFELGTLPDTATLQISPAEVDRLGKEVNLTDLSSKFYLSKDFQLPLPGRTLEFIYEPDTEPSYKKCSPLVVQVHTPGGRFTFVHAPVGCEELQRISLPSVELKGSSHDLRPYALQGPGPHHVRYEFTDNTVVVTINGERKPPLRYTASELGTMTMITLRAGFFGRVTGFRVG